MSLGTVPMKPKIASLILIVLSLLFLRLVTEYQLWMAVFSRSFQKILTILLVSFSQVYNFQIFGVNVNALINKELLKCECRDQ
jgi:hypothetical protein